MDTATPERTGRDYRAAAVISVAAFLVVFYLAGCGTSADTHYKNGRLFLKQDKLKEAMQEADAGMKQESSWRFRILKADIFISRSDGNATKQVLASASTPSDPELLARLRMDQGYAEYLASNYRQAEDLLEQARQIVKPLGLPMLEGLIQNRLGVVQTTEGRMDMAERNLRHVIELTDGRDDHLHATGMGNLGFVFLNSFQLEEAIYWFEKAAASFHQLAATTSYYITIGNLGSCYYRLGDSEKALQYFQEAEGHARQTGNRYMEQLWIGNRGSVLYDRGDLPQAREKFEQALQIARSLDKNEKDLTGWWYYSLASVSIDLHDFDAAENYNLDALRLRQAIGDHSDFYPRVNEAHIAAGRKDPRAEALYRGLIAEYHEGMNPVPMLDARAGLATWLSEKGQFDLADAQFRAALGQLEIQRTALTQADNRMTYLASLIRFYDRYINFLVDRGQTERALEVAESSRARVLDESLGSKYPQEVVTAARLRGLAGSSNAVFLSYWLGKDRSFLWAVTPNEITQYELPKESQITSLVAGYRSLIDKLRDPLQSEHPAGHKLSEILLGPVRGLLASAHHVVLVPDRSLHSLNFETLPDPGDPSKYFIERATVEVAPSLNMLASRRPPAAPTDALLLIGNPDTAVEEYPRLPLAGTEIALISKAAPARKQTVIEGSQAVPSAYRDARPAEFTWIHFAAHAAANQASPLDSALILSRGDSGYQLSAREVMNIPLKANLVTLSACRSAGAKTFSGEGLVGLSWAFLRAGSRSVVAGLWDVTDGSTAELMADFYTQLARNAAPDEALRHAKLTLLHGGTAYQKPFYWGPFQLYAGAM